MASSISNYKCPACTGPLHFVGSSGKLECDYCGSVYEVSEIEALQAESEAKAEQAFAQQQADQSAQGDEWDTSGLNTQWNPQGMTAYNCPSCGAELICDENTAATNCPYCGNPAVVPGQFSGSLKPDFILPFKLDRNAALEALKNHYGGRHKILLPKPFVSENHIEEIQGVYVPFWLYDADADAQAQFEATRSFSRREGKDEVTTTEHYNVYRSGSVRFEKVPVDASSRMSDNYMDSIEPYDYQALKSFSTAYLPGFLADKYDVSPEDCAARADKRCENSAYEAMRSTVQGYDSVRLTGGNVSLHRGKVHYALLPVWLLYTKWNNEDFLFAMNGQTGKLIGSLPVDQGRYWRLFAAIAVGLGAAAAAILSLLNMMLS